MHPHYKVHQKELLKIIDLIIIAVSLFDLILGFLPEWLSVVINSYSIYILFSGYIIKKTKQFFTTPKGLFTDQLIVKFYLFSICYIAYFNPKYGGLDDIHPLLFLAFTAAFFIYVIYSWERDHGDVPFEEQAFYRKLNNLGLGRARDKNAPPMKGHVTIDNLPRYIRHFLPGISIIFLGFLLALIALLLSLLDKLLIFCYFLFFVDFVIKIKNKKLFEDPDEFFLDIFPDFRILYRAEYAILFLLSFIALFPSAAMFYLFSTPSFKIVLSSGWYVITEIILILPLVCHIAFWIVALKKLKKNIEHNEYQRTVSTSDMFRQRRFETHFFIPLALSYAYYPVVTILSLFLQGSGSMTRTIAVNYLFIATFIGAEIFLIYLYAFIRFLPVLTKHSAFDDSAFSILLASGIMVVSYTFMFVVMHAFALLIYPAIMIGLIIFFIHHEKVIPA
jgi:hypothetical protein